MKKFIALFLVLCTIFTITACGSDPEKLEWEGFSGLPFKNMLEKGVPKLIGTNVTVSIKEGWDTTELDDSNVDEAYTFVVVTEEFEIDSYEFFMAVEDDKLVANGAVAHEADEDDFIYGDQAYEILEEVSEEL